MVEAHKCDICGELSEGEPALRIQANVWARMAGGDVVLKSGDSLPWIWQDTELDLCPEHAKDVMEVIIDD